MNFLKTTVLLATLTGLLVAIGGLIGGTGGMIFALIFAGVMRRTMKRSSAAPISIGPHGGSCIRGSRFGRPITKPT